MVNWSASQGVRLRALFPRAEFFAAGEISATSCCSDSRRVQQGDLFVALPGVEPVLLAGPPGRWLWW